MEAQDSSNFTCHVGDGQISFGNGQQPFSFTWNPPTAPVADDVVEGNDRKRRRVQVDVDKQGIAVLKLGSEMTFDFKSTHAKTEMKLVNVLAERNELRAEVEALKTELVNFSKVLLQRDELQGKLQETGMMLEHSHIKVLGCQGEICELEMEKTSLEQGRDRQKIQLSLAGQRIRELKGQIQTDKAAAAAAQGGFMKQIQEHQEAKKKVQNAMNQLRANKNEHCRRLQETVNRAEIEKGQMKTAIDEHIREKTTALENGEALQHQLEASQKELARLSVSLQRLQSFADNCKGCERLEKELKEALNKQVKADVELHKPEQAAAKVPHPMFITDYSDEEE